MLIDVLHRPWFYAGLLSTFALAVLSVQQYEHARRGGMSAANAMGSMLLRGKSDSCPLM